MSLLGLIADIPTNAVLRLNAAALEKKVADLETENAQLKQKVSKLESDLAAKMRAEAFIEHRGALFKRKPGGGYHLAVYCPKCKQSAGSAGASMGGRHGARVPFSCDCGWIANFGQKQLEHVMSDLP